MKKMLLLFLTVGTLLSCSVDGVESELNEPTRQAFTGCSGSGWQVFKASNGRWYLFEHWGSGGNISLVTAEGKVTGSQGAAEAYCLQANQ